MLRVESLVNGLKCDFNAVNVNFFEHTGHGMSGAVLSCFLHAPVDIVLDQATNFTLAIVAAIADVRWAPFSHCCDDRQFI